MDSDDTDTSTNGRGLSWRSRINESPSRRSIVSSKDDDVDQFSMTSTRRLGESRRTRRRDSSPDLAALMNSRFFFRGAGQSPATDLLAASRSVNADEENWRRMDEWLHGQARTASQISLHGTPFRKFAGHGGGELARGSNNTPAVSGHSGQGPARSYNSTPARSNNKSVHADPSNNGHPLSASCKLPCQACGNAPQSDAPPLPPPKIPVLRKTDRMSRSAREQSELGVRLTQSPVVIESNVAPVPPIGMYKRHDRLSKSARHPEMAFEIAASGKELKSSSAAKDKKPGKQGGSPDTETANLPEKSISSSISKGEKTRGTDENTLISELNLIQEPKLVYSVSTRERGRNDRVRQMENISLASPFNMRTSEGNHRSPAATVQNWFSSLLKKGPKTGTEGVKHGRPPRPPRSRPSDPGSLGTQGVSLRRMGVMEDKPEKLMPGATLNDVLNTKGMLKETKIIKQSSLPVAANTPPLQPKDTRRSESQSNKAELRSQEQKAAPPPVAVGQLSPQLRRSSSVPHSDKPFLDLQEAPAAGALLDGVQGHKRLANQPDSPKEPIKVAKGDKREKERILSPPKRRQVAASRLGRKGKEGDSPRLSTGKQGTASPQNVKQTEVATSEQKNQAYLNDIQALNEFLRRQRAIVSKFPSTQSTLQFNIVLSGHDSSLGSIVSTICYAWILKNVSTIDKDWIPVPVLNITRRSMWNHRQAAWLFQQCGLDTRALLFCDEVDLENLALAGQYRLSIVGQDILRTNGAVASCCTVLTELFSEEAQRLLQATYMKMLLLAGLLFDTENLDTTSVFSSARDEAVVALLSQGAGPAGRIGFYNQLKQKHDDPFFRVILKEYYGERPLLRETIPEEADEDMDVDEAEAEDQITSIPERSMPALRETKDLRVRTLSASSSTTDCSEPFTNEMETSPSTRPTSTNSNGSFTNAQLEHSSANAGRLQPDGSPTPGGGSKRAINRTVGRFLTGLTRSRNNTVVA